MSSTMWKEIGLVALVGLGCEAFFGFGLCFAPGWANGWPFGLTARYVWSSGMIILFFLLLVTSAVGAGAAAGLICSEFGIGLRHGARVFEAWFVISVLCALVLSAHAFKVVFASTKDMFLPS